MQIHKPLSYRRWLKQKAQTSKAVQQQGASNNADGEEEEQEKRAKSEAAFREWVRRKQKQTRIVKRQQKQQQKEKATQDNIQAERTAPSLSKASSAPSLQLPHRPHKEAESAQAYGAWLARVRLEDAVKRAQHREERAKLAQQQRAIHEATWRKKLAVCAYSTCIPSCKSLGL
ncbi:hypothetical protein BBJ28_00000683 [Nothophytophthora sp. Chile5]|nr:hypothetical protein BBJ28_00000683 [Nothophytophthora sp. Chile5]